MGRLITFEGIDFCGKSIQSKLLYERINRLLGRSRPGQVLLLREPGGTVISEKVREILLDRSLDMMNEITELLLYEAARSQLIVETIRPALEANKVVICDRFYDSTTAYQGYGRGIPLEIIKSAHGIATHGVRPDVTFVLDVDPAVAYQRQQHAGRTRDRMEKEHLDFHHRVRNGFLEIAEEEPDRIVVVDGHRPVEEIARQIWRVTKKLFS